MKKLALLWILILAFQLLAQDKSVALKFDEFSDYPIEATSYYRSLTNYPSEKILSFDERVERFAERMKRESKSKNAIIIYYNERKGKYPLDKGKYLAEQAGNRLEYNNFQIAKERIILIDGGYREYPTLEFWIAPKDAELPKPTSAYSPSETVICPEINVAGDGFGKDRDQPLKFSVAIKDQEPDSKLNLEWNVSAGKIIKGQNTNQIEVDLSETDAKFISASVTVSGLHPECDNHKFASTRVGSFPYKIDEFPHIYWTDISARMQGVMIELSLDPTATIEIIIYGNRKADKKR